MSPRHTTCEKGIHWLPSSVALSDKLKRRKKGKKYERSLYKKEKIIQLFFAKYYHLLQTIEGDNETQFIFNEFFTIFN